jgi:transcriptional regulator with XRE-family HTH domain
MKKRIMNIEEKRQFQQLRAQGTRIKECAKILGYSVSTCSKLEKKRTNGTLALEILTADNPERVRDIARLAYLLKRIDEIEDEIATRDIGLLSTSKLIGAHKTNLDAALKLKRDLYQSTGTTTSEPDDLDEIWSQVARAEGPK